MTRQRLGAIETGGTKVICLVGSGPTEITARTRIPTGEPKETLDAVVGFFLDQAERGGPLDAVGIASFGPLELRRSHQQYGFITNSPKPGWGLVDMVGPVRSALGVPVGFDTDVNGAALGEGRWGAARGLESFVYVTVGTGVGAGAVVNGKVVHGLGHTEMGHMSLPRQHGDDFPGDCMYHGDCLEGLAGGAAIAARWSRPAEQLEGERLRQAIELEATYLALGLRTMVYTLAPQRIVVGGSVSALPGLLPLVRQKLVEELAGYPGLPEHAEDDFVSPAELGNGAGPAGAFVLAAGSLGGAEVD